LAVSSNPKSVVEIQQRISLLAKWLLFISPPVAGFECPLAHEMIRKRRSSQASMRGARFTGNFSAI
jgi:hypothetical protein